MAESIVKSLEALVAEKQAVLKREQTLMAELNAALPRIGYRVVRQPKPELHVAPPRSQPCRPETRDRSPVPTAAEPSVCRFTLVAT